MTIRTLALLLCLSGSSLAQQPDWVGKSSDSEPGEDGLLSGVGRATGLDSPEKRRALAEQLAREQIAKALGGYSTSLNQAFLTATNGGPADQQIVEAIKGFATDQLAHVKILDHYIAPDGSECALAGLESDSISDSLDAMKARSPVFARTLNSDKRFSRYQFRKANLQKRGSPADRRAAFKEKMKARHEALEQKKAERTGKREASAQPPAKAQPVAARPARQEPANPRTARPAAQTSRTAEKTDARAQAAAKKKQLAEERKQAAADKKAARDAAKASHSRASSK